MFEVFLPQLLLYPNPTDPLNSNAASMLLRSPDSFKSTVKEYIVKFARDVSMAEAALADEGVKRAHSSKDDDDTSSLSDDDDSGNTSHIPDL